MLHHGRYNKSGFCSQIEHGNEKKFRLAAFWCKILDIAVAKMVRTLSKLKTYFI
jgi:hypothetical protein